MACPSPATVKCGRFRELATRLTTHGAGCMFLPVKMSQVSVTLRGDVLYAFRQRVGAWETPLRKFVSRVDRTIPDKLVWPLTCMDTAPWERTRLKEVGPTFWHALLEPWGD